MKTTDELMQVIEDVMIDADVDYPAGYEAGPCITFDTDKIRAALEAAFAAKPAEPAAWLDDGSCRAGSDRTAHRVVTDMQKRDMPAAVSSSFTVPLYLAPPAPAVSAQCCMCGKKGLSTAEDGGPECELDDGRWVCSIDCWDRAVMPVIPEGWQDISTAPHSKQVLVFVPRADQPSNLPVGSWHIAYQTEPAPPLAQTWRYANGQFRGQQIGWPTHWMPLPTAPLAVAPKGGANG